MAIPLRVLIIEDQPADAELMVYELRKAGFDPQWHRVETVSDYRAALDRNYDLVLSDHVLPEFDGLLALRMFQERGLDIPFILVSGTIDEDRAVAAMRDGAADYLLKDRMARLGPAVVRALERNSARKAKRQAEAQMRLVLDRLPVAAYTCDGAGLITYFNAQAERTWGRKPALNDPADRYYGSFKLYSVDGSPIASDQSWMAQALREKKPFLSREIVSERPDGKRLTILAHASPICDESGEVLGGVNILVDITERKQLQAQFLQAQKMEAFGLLAGGVAHDFNNLLTVICGYSEMILTMLPEQAPSREMVAQIKKAGDRAAGLTQQLLAFSRKQVMQPQVLNLNKELGELKKLLGRLIGEDIELVFDSRCEECFVKVDPIQLQQVIINLAVNARDAMTKGGKLTMATRNIDLDEGFLQNHAKAHVGPHVLLEVSDTGSGMTPEVMSHIFEPFFTTKGLGKGTGLGLSTVIGIVEQSGGFLELESTPGQGTLFRIYLPQATVPSQGTKARPSNQGLRRGGETIFLVEDDAGVRTLTSMVLRSGGYTVLEATDGVNGLEVFAGHQGPIHLLLTDVVMPNMSGCEVAERMTAKSLSLKVLYMSGYLDDAIVRHGIQERGLPFIHKPFHAEALLTKVREVLDQPDAPR